MAPPLKSTSTKLSTSDEWVAARPSTSVRSSSDLPEPVAPTTRPCGPMPSWAASLRSSSTGAPSAPVPIGIRSRSRAARGAQRRQQVVSAMSAMPSSSVRSWSAGERRLLPDRRRPAAAGRAGGPGLASTRDSASARADLGSLIDGGAAQRAVGRRSSTMRGRGRAVRGGAAAESIRVTPASPPSTPRWPAPSVSPPSTMTTIVRRRRPRAAARREAWPRLATHGLAEQFVQLGRPCADQAARAERVGLGRSAGRAAAT